MYSHPAVEGFTMWGFWDGRHWYNNAPLLRSDFSPKPALAAYRALVLQQWKTDAHTTTDTTGQASVRGHLGEFELTVSLPGRSAVARVALDRDAALHQVVLGSTKP